MKIFLRLSVGLLLAGCYVGPPPGYRVREVRPPGLTSDEIVKMSKSGVSDDVVIEKIKEAGLAAKPTAEHLKSLKEQGLSDPVLKAMVDAPVTGAEQRVTEYVYYPRRYYYPSYYPYSYYYPYYRWGYPYGYGWPYWHGYYYWWP